MVLENDRNSTFFPRISLLKLLTCLFFVIKSPNFIASCDALSCPLSIVYMLEKSQLIGEVNSGLLWFCFTSQCDRSRKTCQQDSKLEPTANWSRAFSRALGGLFLFGLSPLLPLRYSPFLRLARVIAMVLF